MAYNVKNEKGEQTMVSNQMGIAAPCLNGNITKKNNTLPQAKPGDRIVYTDPNLVLLFGDIQFLVIKTPPGYPNQDSQGLNITWIRLSDTGGGYCYPEDYKIVKPSEYAEKMWHNKNG